ncbi:hypothetical protein FACS1894202_12770 [Clostridia bacterium]|nr:hypothetical protein FACS1894202_12770 [Clostridia bacterium]
MKKLAIIALAIMVTALAACSELDVVGKESVTSFSTVLTAVGNGASEDEMNGGWSLTAPDDTVRFIWSKDYSKSPLHDVMLELDAQPFIDAGLDTSKLPDNYAFYDGMLMVGTKLGNDELKYSGDATPLAAYEQIVNKYRKSVGYIVRRFTFDLRVGSFVRCNGSLTGKPFLYCIVGIVAADCVEPQKLFATRYFYGCVLAGFDFAPGAFQLNEEVAELLSDD